MDILSQFYLTLLGLLFCVGDVTVLGFLLTWQDRAATPADSRQRLRRIVLPGAIVLLALLLAVLTLLLRLWSGQ